MGFLPLAKTHQLSRPYQQLTCQPEIISFSIVEDANLDLIQILPLAKKLLGEIDGEEVSGLSDVRKILL